MAQADRSIVARRRDIKLDIETICGIAPARIKPDFPVVLLPTGIMLPVDPDEIAAYKHALAAS